MSESKALAPARSYLWWMVLGLVGLDYFSSLAYLPSMAVEKNRLLAPLAAAGVVAATLFGALPIYLYVVGRSPTGTGATGLLERLVHGWRGKLLILILLGFIATDFVITRSLSLADAAVHLIHNPFWKDHVEWISHNQERVRACFPTPLQGKFFDFWNEQLVVTVLLSSLVFGVWALLQLGFTPIFLRVAVVLVGLYLVLNAIVIGSGLVFLMNHPEQFFAWFEPVEGSLRSLPGSLTAHILVSAFWYFPWLALGLSGFELSMASAPLVRGREDDNPKMPTGRIRNTRKLMIVAAVIMGVYLIGSVLVTAILVPDGALRPEDQDEKVGHPVAGQPIKAEASERALAYLAHGGVLRVQGAKEKNAELSSLFGPWFGTLYDLVTILVLCLAGVSFSIGMRDLLPRYLAHYGMQLAWAQRIGVITHLSNLMIIVVTVVFRASVSAQQWAYATSVMVLLTAASLAAVLDVRERLQRSWLRYLASAPFQLICLFFVVMTVLLLYHSMSGLAIALILVALVVATAFLSRWLRSTELRFEGFDFDPNDAHSRQRWEQIRQLPFQVLVPHNPEHVTIQEKERAVRLKHRLEKDVPIIFIEVALGDPSDFFQKPLMEVYREGELEVIRVSGCTSVAHVLAAICLEFREIGRPPEIYFNWSDESPMAANLHFLLLGQGNVPWMVHALVRKAEPRPERRPRVVIG
jgi:hypothetical protein